VRFRPKSLLAIVLTFGATCVLHAQVVAPGTPSSNLSEGFLPPPLKALGPPSPQEVESALGRETKITSRAERLPPAMAIEELPLPNIAPSAILPFSLQERRAELIRRNEVVTLSNSALRNSGVFEMALRNSPTLARSYHNLEAQSLRVQQLSFQVAKERDREAETMNRAQRDPQMSDAMKNQLMMEARAQTTNVQAALDLTVLEQMRAEAQFEDELWNVGVNGAKIGTVTSMARPSAVESDKFVMVKSIGNSPADNLGYSRTQVYHTGELGPTTVPSEYLLPFTVAPNDLFYEKGASYNTQRAPDGLMIPLSDNSATNPVLQILGAPQGYLYYDTGFNQNVNVNGTNFAEGVSLDSRRDHGAGQTFVFNNGGGSIQDFANFDLAANAQVMDIGGGNSLQFFTAANNYFNNNQFSVSTIGVRAYNRTIGSVFEGWSLVAGAKQSIFGETAATPAGLLANRTLVGTVNRGLNNISQIGVVAPLSDLITWKFAVEDPVHAQPDVFYQSAAPGGFTRLNRWPTFATSIVLQDKATSNSLQLGALLRSNGFESNSTSEEFFETGWGLSAIAQFRSNNSMNFLGVAGGEGVGRYIQGIQYAAAANVTAGTIDSLRAAGAYIGRQTWWYDECNNPIAVCNIAYGYSLMENPDLVTLDPNRKLHQAWINYTRFIGDRLGVGLEWQYGFREVGSGNVGEDHRFTLVFSVRSAPTQKSTQVQNYVADPVTGRGGLDEGLGAPSGAMNALQPMGATINGRPVEDVVSQYQLGGSAFQQGL
jgi:hypothetical protein